MDRLKNIGAIGRERAVGCREGDAASEPLALPLFSTRVQAGFPSPADDFMEGTLDLGRHLIRRPSATFLLRVAGESMTGVGIYPDDLLVVDRSITPRGGHIVIAIVDGELTLKRLETKAGRVRLVAENPAFRAIEPAAGEEVEIWGVVIHAIHSFVTV